MQRFVIALIAGFLLSLNTKAQSPEQWQKDVRHLQQVVHAKYANLFHTITAAEWDKEVEGFYKSIPSLDSYAVLAGFMRLVALFHIGHTQVTTFNLHEGTPRAFRLRRYPYRLYWFADGLYITAADKGYATAVGGKVLKIGGKTWEEALEAIRPIVAYENEQGFKSNAVAYLAIPEFLKAQQIADNADEVGFVIQKDGREQTVQFKAGDFQFSSATGLEVPGSWQVARKGESSVPLWQKEPAAYRYFEYLPSSKTVYVRHSVVLNDGQKTISDFFKQVFEFVDKNDVQKFILDVRMNGGGNNYLNKSVITGIIASRKINQRGKFYCIIGRRTFSAAQNLVNELEKYTEVTFAGEPTSENVNFYGDTKVETLPNSKLNVNLSWLWWQNLDPRDSRKATSPQLSAEMSFDDYLNNRDPAFAVIMNDKGSDLLTELVDLIEKKKQNDALELARRFKANPVNRYVTDRLENNINNKGYELLQSGNVGTASSLFEINTKLFPESANVYDSYAESLAKLGRNEEAIKYYETAISRDKDGATAENARKMIEKIKEKKAF